MKKPKRASSEAMGALHELLALTLAEAIKNPGVDESGNKLPPPAPILSVARQFLKDNHIEVADPADVTSPIGSLASALPFTGSDDELPMQ